MPIDAAELERYLALLETAGDQVDRKAAVALRRTQDALAAYAQSIAHVKTGVMRDTLHGLGPFAIGNGVLESLISAAPDYTVFELARGGDHDWAGRTLGEQSATLDALEDETGRIVATAIGAGL